MIVYRQGKKQPGIHETRLLESDMPHREEAWFTGRPSITQPLTWLRLPHFAASTAIPTISIGGSEGSAEQRLVQKLSALAKELPAIEEAATTKGRPAVKQASSMVHSALHAAIAAVSAAHLPNGTAGKSTTALNIPSQPAVMIEESVFSHEEEPPPPSLSVGLLQIDDFAAKPCNAATDEDAEALEKAASLVATGGRYVELEGYALTGEPGAIDVQQIDRADAESRVAEDPEKLFAFLTVDANPDGFPKVLCHSGFPLLHQPDTQQVCTAHVWRPPGSLPSSGEATLFVDGLKLADRSAKVHGLKRPSRGEGLADEWTSKLCLFDDCIEPSDLRQGGLGNCWLISAFSALAEFPERIRERIKQTEISKAGYYDVSLFDPVDEKWVHMRIDDRFPTNPFGRLRNVKISVSGEIWPVVFEKAFAALWGGYQFLDGGNPYVALKALTGTAGQDLVCIIRSRDDPDVWQCWTPNFRRNPTHGFPEAPQLTEATWPDNGERGCVGRNSDRMLDLLMWFDRGECVMCCGSGGTDDSVTSLSGVVQGHAYALLTIAANIGSEGQFDLLKLRNPHGQGGKEWAGTWCDGHPIWESFPDVKAKLNPLEAADGTFWMAREDFVKEFRSVSVCLSASCAAERGRVDYSTMMD